MVKKDIDNIHVVNQIVDRGLCIRCGVCEPACPVDIIRFDNLAYPYLTDGNTCTNCTRCLKVCPGEVVNFSELDDKMFGIRPRHQSITGITREVLVGSATDDKVRKGGTSGGFVTQLLIYMLNKHLIDGALVLGSSADSNGWQAVPLIARTAEELKRAAKSKYTAVPSLKLLAEIKEVDGKYAVVGLPCFIHGLRKYQRISKRLRERIKLVIGLSCNTVLEPYVLDELCEFKGFKKYDIVNFHFRYGSWPGNLYAQFKDGSYKKMLKLGEERDEFNLLKLFYSPLRCNMCIDFSAEYSDISVADPWLRGPDGKYLFPDDWTTVLIRTEHGEDIVKMATADGYINVQEISLKTYMMNFEIGARYKRDFVPKYIILRKLLGFPFPQYHRSIAHGKISSFLPVIFRAAIIMMAKYKWFRMLGLFFAQVRPTIALFAWNRKRKEKKFVNKYSEVERFVEKLYQHVSKKKEQISIQSDKKCAFIKDNG